MNNQINTPMNNSSPLHSFYFKDQPKASRQRNVLRSPVSSSQHCKKSFQTINNDRQLCRQNNQNKLVEQCLLDNLQQNQFMQPFTLQRKNTNCPMFEISQILRKETTIHEPVTSYDLHLLSPQLEDQCQNFFLLDTETYKEICSGQHQKEVEIVSNLDMRPFTNLQGMCRIHNKPFQIVCIEDRLLMCSHCAIFGQHKTHSLVPLVHVEKCIQVKKSKINQIMKDYKTLQLGIKQKAFASQFVQKINQRKHQANQSVMTQFKKIKQFIASYQNQICGELQRFYLSLENRVHQAISRTSNESNVAAFQQWQQDAISMVRQMNYQQLSSEQRINIFLNNFEVSQLISNSSTQPYQHGVSVQGQGKKYLNQIEQQLNLTIQKVIQTTQKFDIKFDDQYQGKIREFVSFQCQTSIQDLILQNKLITIQERFKSQLNFDEIKLPMSKQFRDTCKPVNMKKKQHQLSSTVNSMTRSLRVSLMSGVQRNNPTMMHKAFQRLGSSNAAIEFGSPTRKRMSIKYNRRQTLEDMRRLENGMKSGNKDLDISEARSLCDFQGERKRRISPCYRNIVTVQNQRQSVSTANSRINRCKSRDVLLTHRLQHQQNNIQAKDFKRKIQVQCQSPQPLRLLQQYQSSETQTFDLSNCKLNDSQIVYFVQRAMKIRKIKRLKLSSNMLTSSGLQKILPCLSCCNLINLSNNRLSQLTIDILLKRKETISSLKILNLANNKLNQRKIKEKIAEFKKMGIVVTL